MLPQVNPQFKPVFIAALLAYRALAAPTGHDEQDQVRSVINALRDQIKILNLSWKPSIMDDVELALQAGDSWDDEVIAAFNQEIEARTIRDGFDPDFIAAHTLEYLISRGAFVDPEEPVVDDKFLYLTTDMIDLIEQEHEAEKREAEKRDCPHKGKLCGGCVIL